MTKIQIYQLIAIILLVGFVLISYQQESRNDLIFYPIIGINLALWILRLRERRHRSKSRDV